MLTLKYRTLTLKTHKKINIISTPNFTKMSYTDNEDNLDVIYSDIIV